MRAEAMKTLVRDPVCGMDVSEESPYSEVVQGRTYSFCSCTCQEQFHANPAKYTSGLAPKAGHSKFDLSTHSTLVASGKDRAKDPICGMVVDKATALHLERTGRNYYFCSVNCQRTFESPERELKSMRRRVTIALVAAWVLMTFGLSFWSGLFAAFLLFCPAVIVWGVLTTRRKV